jgi:hypothetical protein
MVRIDEDLAEPYRSRAENQDRSLSAEIRQALRRDLQRDVEDVEPTGRAA